MKSAFVLIFIATLLTFSLSHKVAEEELEDVPAYSSKSGKL